MATLLVQAGIVMVAYLFASETADVAFEIAVDFPLILLNFLIDLGLLNIGLEWSLLCLYNFLYEVGGLRFAVDVRSRDLVSMDSGGEGFALKHFIAPDGENS